MKRICYLIFRLLFLLDGGWSLRNLSMSVPRAVLGGPGQAATLRCGYDLEGAALYSIRWYRAHTEFYRFVPRELPPHMVFPLPGASVDLTQSDAQQVRVVGLTRRLSGEYQCEVSADAPLFHTAILRTNLTVVDPPFRAPQLSVERASYSRGDTLAASCSVDPSYPAPNISWLIDGHKIGETVSAAPAESDFRERAAHSRLALSVLPPPAAAPPHESEPALLRYALAAPRSGQFSLSCMAVIFDVYARQSERLLVREDTPRPASVTGDDSAGPRSAGGGAVLAAWCAVAVALL